MKVFLSWSGAASKAVAASLRKNLPLILQDLEVFMSKHDIESGARWAHTLADELDKSDFGILCLTRENLQSSWLLFEAGSLVKHSHGRACGLLIGDLVATDIPGPLAQFQHRKFEQSEILHLLKDLNGKLQKPLESDDLSKLLGKFWPDISSEYEEALKLFRRGNQPPARSDRELLEEILTRVRGVQVEQYRAEGVANDVEGDLHTRPVSIDSLAWYSLWKFPDKPISDRVQLILLRDLDKGRYQTVDDIDQAVNRSAAAVQAYAAENPEFFKFGTDYITKSLGFVDADFRARHGFAARTLRAFEKYGGLVKSP